MEIEGSYVCTLDQQTQQKAYDELNEDPKQRNSQIEALRQWVKDEPHINSRTDDEFLLRFLRVAKFSQLRAQEILDNFWTTRSVAIPEWFGNMDPYDTQIQKILDLGVQTVLPGTDDEGKKVMLVRAGSYDPKAYSLDDIMKVSFMVMDVLLLDEPTQVHGIVIVQDFQGIGTGHLFAWNRDVIAKASRCWQDVYPFRNKGSHYYNTPAIINPLLDIFSYFMKDKSRQRMKFHKCSTDSLHRALPKRILPTELGGDAGPLADMIQNTKKMVVDHREEFLLNARYGVDESKRPKRDQRGQPASGWGITGSFRKLSND